MTDRLYSAGTVEHSARESRLFAASGKKSGHGTIAWLPAPAYEMKAGPPFVLHAEDYGWQSPVRDDDASPDMDGNYRSHWGHATFVAGLIRQAAPGAQVLSMRVMNSQGKVSEDDAAMALKWLADNPESGGGVDIVLMAFGRQDDPGDHDLEKLREPIKKLSERGVRIVASAGNDGTERPVYPAAFAAEQELSRGSGRSVVSVGALATPTERAPYSNYGPWVAEWCRGTNVISIMPLTTKSPDDRTPGFDNAAAPARGDGYAWWSGTSFAAGRAAGKLAASLTAGQALPGSATGS